MSDPEPQAGLQNPNSSYLSLRSFHFTRCLHVRPGTTGGITELKLIPSLASLVSHTLGAFMSDPELQAGLQNPKIMAALQEMMASGGGMPDISKYQNDPEVSE